MSMEMAKPPPVGTMVGPALIGCFLNWGLFGVLSVQVFLYYLAFSRDRWSLKALVYGLFMLDTAQTILATQEAFVKYGLGFGNMMGLVSVGTGWLSFPIIGSITATTVQLFFAHRIMKLSESKILGIFVAILAILAGTAGLTTGIQAKIINNFPQLAVKAKVALTIWLTMTAACDLVIAVAMTVILSKKRTGFSAKTDDAITNIIRLTIETGTLTAVLAILSVILFFVCLNTAYWAVPLDILGKVYSNSLLVILNRRMKISFDGSESSQSGPQNSYTRFGSQPGVRSGQTGVDQVDMPIIKIQREVWPRDDSNRAEKADGFLPQVAAHPYSSPSTHHMV